jgi:hypothetical protein
MKKQLAAFPLFTQILWLCLADYRAVMTSRGEIMLSPDHNFQQNAFSPPSLPRAPANSLESISSSQRISSTALQLSAHAASLPPTESSHRDGDFCNHHHGLEEPSSCNYSRNPIRDDGRPPERNGGHDQPRITTRIPTLSPPSALSSGQQVLVMPQEKAPRLTASISDIPNLVRTFLPLYRIYSRAYTRQRLQFQTIFECFSEQQQRTLQLSTMLSYEDLMTLPNDSILDHLRILWGLKTKRASKKYLFCHALPKFRDTYRYIRNCKSTD